jgi:hypothetical protein
MKSCSTSDYSDVGANCKAISKFHEAHGRSRVSKFDRFGVEHRPPTTSFYATCIDQGRMLVVEGEISPPSTGIPGK